jgi:hypothetical protein
MDAALEAKVSAKKIKEFSDKVISKYDGDAAIIGVGFILRIGDKRYNASVVKDCKY